MFVSKYKSLWIPTLLKSSHLMTKRKVLVDSGATDNFICSRLLKHLKIGRLKLKNPRTIWNIDGTHNKSGTINECVNLLVWVGDRRQEMCFLITDLGEDAIVLGYPWLTAFLHRLEEHHTRWRNAALGNQNLGPFLGQRGCICMQGMAMPFRRTGSARRRNLHQEDQCGTSQEVEHLHPASS